MELLGWVFLHGNNDTKAAVISRDQHREAYEDWQRKLQAVEENEWQDEKMISDLKEAWIKAGQALRKRTSKDRVYREALQKQRKNAWRRNLQSIIDYEN